MTDAYIPRMFPPVPRQAPEQMLETAVRLPTRRSVGELFELVRVHVLDEPDAALPWIDAARALSNRGVFSENVLAFLAHLFIMSAMRTEMDEDLELARLSAQIDEIEQEYEMEDPDDDYGRPEDSLRLRVLSAAWDARHTRLVKRHLRKLGCDDIVTLLDTRRRKPDRALRGRKELWPHDEDGSPKRMRLDR